MKICCLKHAMREVILFLFGGIVYLGIELLWRGWTHWSMAIVGGLCFAIIGLLNESYTFDDIMEVQAVKSAVIVTILEFVSGYIINIKLGWDVWDYSNVPFNLMGQVCLLYAVLWVLLAIPAIYLDDVLRYVWWKEPWPKYEWGIKNGIEKLTKKGN